MLTQYFEAQVHLQQTYLLSGKLHHHSMLLLKHGAHLKACEAQLCHCDCDAQRV